MTQKRKRGEPLYGINTRKRFTFHVYDETTWSSIAKENADKNLKTANKNPPTTKNNK